MLLLLTSQANFSAATGRFNNEMQGLDVPAISDSENDQTLERQQDEEDVLDSDGRVFGYKNSYIHAALGLQGEWTDNLYNYDPKKQSNFLTQISPSVWMTWPRRSRRPLQIAADNTAVGGLQYSLSEYEVYNKFELYLSGKMDFMTYSADSALNHVEHGVQGQATYKPFERLSVQLIDNFAHSQDIFNIAESTAENNRAYDANVFKTEIDWRISDKISAKGGYTNHRLVYDLAVNKFTDRSDSGFDAALSYDYSPKTNFFAGFSLFKADYKENEMPDNTNTFLRGGINWQATVKTACMLSAGYQQVDYDEDWNDAGAQALAGTLDGGKDAFHFEAQAIWKATRKSEFLLNSKYNVEQSDSRYALNKTVWAARTAYGYQFSGRLRGTLNFIYEDSDYTQFDGSSRLDERWNIGPRVDFAVKKWLFFSLYYNFDKKDSNFNELDYKTNTLGIGARGTF